MWFLWFPASFLTESPTHRPSEQVPDASAVLPTESQVFTLVSRPGFSHPYARMHVELLGPCFKTGRLRPCLTGILRTLAFELVDKFLSQQVIETDCARSRFHPKTATTSLHLSPEQ